VKTVRGHLVRQSGQLVVTASRDAKCKVGDKSFSVDASREKTVRLPVGSVTVVCTAENPDGTRATSSATARVVPEGAQARVELGPEPPAPPGYWSDRANFRYGVMFGTGGTSFAAAESFTKQVGWNWALQLELNVLEFFIVQGGGNIVSINDSAGNGLYVWGPTAAVGLRPFRGNLQPWLAFRGAGWGSHAVATSAEGGIRLFEGNLGIDLSFDYGLTGPVPWVAMVWLAYTSSR
jgi:hypothetical protein